MEPRTGNRIRSAGAAAIVLLAACASARSPSVSLSGALGAACEPSAASCNVVSGYAANRAADDITGATISGGGQRGAANRVTGNYATVGGGEDNLAGEGSTVAGGSSNTAVNFRATVGGGANNAATAHEATVSGGFKNTASGRLSAVGGGSANIADNLNATVSGGSGNTAAFTFAAVGGGTQNTASSTAAVVAGGDHNLAGGAYSGRSGRFEQQRRGLCRDRRRRRRQSCQRIILRDPRRIREFCRRGLQFRRRPQRECEDRPILAPFSLRTPTGCHSSRWRRMSLPSGQPAESRLVTSIDSSGLRAFRRAAQRRERLLGDPQRCQRQVRICGCGRATGPGKPHVGSNPQLALRRARRPPSGTSGRRHRNFSRPSIWEKMPATSALSTPMAWRWRQSRSCIGCCRVPGLTPCRHKSTPCSGA